MLPKRPSLHHFEIIMSQKYCSGNVMPTNPISLAHRFRGQLNKMLSENPYCIWYI